MPLVKKPFDVIKRNSKILWLVVLFLSVVGFILVEFFGWRGGLVAGVLGFILATFMAITSCKRIIDRSRWK